MMNPLLRSLWRLASPLLRAALSLLLVYVPAAQAEPAPVLVGMSAEFGHLTSTSDDAIRLGIQIAMDEINRDGGVLNGRPLKLIERDDRSVPARGVANYREFAALPDLVAAFCGKFSPVALEAIPVIHETRLILLNPWSAADAIVDNGRRPNYAFRLSLTDSWAVSTMLKSAAARKLYRVGILAPNTAWGRSSLIAAERHAASDKRMKLVGVQWYNWGDTSLVAKYRQLRDAGAQALLLVANEKEGSVLAKEMAALAAEERMPVLSHWGITGGDFVKLTDGALATIDLSVVQTFSFIGVSGPAAKRVSAAALKALNADRVEQIPSPVGLAHAYDLTHLLARAINKAGSTDRAAIRSALEQLDEYRGLVKTYARPFSPQRHEALAESDVFMARFEADGSIHRIRP
ncbi:MAG: ABC transporter substrate-binding protein [Betaproteobacteria bacterium]|nr:ABC transporter substrate-binding protein [Betaproteobacteria bacterium]